MYFNSHLARNPLICDCNLRWLPQYLEKYPVETSGVRCLTPRRVKRKKISQLKSDKFKCKGTWLTVHKHLFCFQHLRFKSQAPKRTSTSENWRRRGGVGEAGLKAMSRCRKDYSIGYIPFAWRKPSWGVSACYSSTIITNLELAEDKSALVYWKDLVILESLVCSRAKKNTRIVMAWVDRSCKSVEAVKGLKHSLTSKPFLMI